MYFERSNGRTGVALLLTVLMNLSFMLLPARVEAAPPLILPVTPGWDVFEPGNGTVSMTVTKIDGLTRLKFIYVLQGAKPLQSYKVCVGIFGLQGDGLKTFGGVPRYKRDSWTRELITATHDSFILGDFRTDRLGKGEKTVELTLRDVPTGTYEAQFTWASPIDSRGHYRTGTKYGVGFAKIIVS